MLRLELNAFRAAVQFLTRLPVGGKFAATAEDLARSHPYFPLAGAILGAACGAVYWVLASLFPVEIAVVLTMAASLLLTGALHEDGFTDVADAFGGGWTKERILEIMRDSRIGAYGAAGLWFALAIKFFALREIGFHGGVSKVAVAFIVSYAISRLACLWWMKFLPYVRETSRVSKPLVDTGTRQSLTVATGYTVGLIFFLLGLKALVMLPLIGVTLYGIWCYFKAKLAGITGDCLGCGIICIELVSFLLLVRL